MLLFVVVTARFFLIADFTTGLKPCPSERRQPSVVGASLCEAGFGFVARRGELYPRGELRWDSSLRSE